LDVLIVEAGLNNNDPILTTPAFAFDNLDNPDSPYFDQYVATPNANVNGRSLVVQAGRVLGGGSSVNLMMYARPAASDIDDWNTEGWSFEEVEPLYKKVCKPRTALIGSLRLTTSQRARKTMDIADPFKYLMVGRLVMFGETFLLLQRPIPESILLLIYKTSTP
jgi:choline dehydrogenase-like flavoprotein